MRVLVLTNLYPTPYAPDRATFNRQQLAALARQHEVRVIAPIAWTDEWSARAKKGDGLSADRRRVCDGMIIDHPRYLFTPKVLRGAYGHFAVHSVRRCFERAVAESRPDVVLGCWAYPDGWAAVRLGREAGLPVVLKVHGSDLLSLPARGARRARTAETLTSADAVVAVSRHLADHAVQIGAAEAHTHVVYNGIDRQLFRPGPQAAARATLRIDQTEPLILFVGNLVAVKAIDRLIDACASLASQGTAFNCAIVGHGPLKDHLQAQIERRGLAQRVRLVGPRPLAELPTWYQAASLVVLPSRSEGVPNVLLEASACGTPFVATRAGGIPEIAPPESLVPPDDVAALAERIQAMLTQRDVTPPPFTAGTWDESAEALGAVLRSTVDRVAASRSRAA